MYESHLVYKFPSATARVHRSPEAATRFAKPGPNFSGPLRNSVPASLPPAAPGTPGTGIPQLHVSLTGAALLLALGRSQALADTVPPDQIIYRIGGMIVDDPAPSAGANARLFGTFRTPEGQLTLGSRVNLEGALVGWQVEIGPGAQITASPASNLGN